MLWIIVAALVVGLAGWVVFFRKSGKSATVTKDPTMLGKAIVHEALYIFL